MKKVIKTIIIVGLLILNNTVYAKSGCCSWHKGVSGCGSNGRIICNDGTYSPSCTCTPPKVYGCTDWNAINYNSNANTDNGSCKYQKEEYETVILEYETEIQNPNQIENGKEIVIQIGKNGEKRIKYKIIADARGTQLSKEIESEEIVTKPINQIILIEEIKQETEKLEETMEQESSSNNKNNNPTKLEDIIAETIVVGGIGGIGYQIYKKKRKS